MPQEYDALMLPPGNPNRDAAVNTLSDPNELMKRAAPGLLMGTPAAMLGAKLPPAWPVTLPPREASAALVKTYWPQFRPTRRAR